MSSHVGSSPSQMASASFWAADTCNSAFKFDHPDSRNQELARRMGAETESIAHADLQSIPKFLIIATAKPANKVGT